MSATPGPLRAALAAAGVDLGDLVDALVNKHGDSDLLQEMKAKYFGEGTQLSDTLPWRHVLLNVAIDCFPGLNEPIDIKQFSADSFDVRAAIAALPNLNVPALDKPWPTSEDELGLGWYGKFAKHMRWVLNQMHARDCSTLGRVEDALHGSKRPFLKWFKSMITGFEPSNYEDEPEHRAALARKHIDQVMGRFASKELDNGASLSAEDKAELAAFALMHQPWTIREYASVMAFNIGESDYDGSLNTIIDYMEEDMFVEQEIYPWFIRKCLGLEPEGRVRKMDIVSKYDPLPKQFEGITKEALKYDCDAPLEALCGSKARAGTLTEGFDALYARQLAALYAQYADETDTSGEMHASLRKWLHGPFKEDIEACDLWSASSMSLADAKQLLLSVFGVTVGFNPDEPGEFSYPFAYTVEDDGQTPLLHVSESELIQRVEATRDAVRQKLLEKAAADGSEEPPSKKRRADNEDEAEQAADGDTQMQNGVAEGLKCGATTKACLEPTDLAKTPGMVLRANANPTGPGAVHRLLRKCGVVAETDESAAHVLSQLKRVVSEVVGAARKDAADGPVTSAHLVKAFGEHADRPIRVYGYGVNGIRGLWSAKVYYVLKQVHPDTGVTADALAVLNDIASFALSWTTEDLPDVPVPSEGVTVAFTLKGCDLEEEGDKGIPSLPLVTTVTASESGSDASLQDIARNAALQSDATGAELPPALLSVLAGDTGILALRDPDASMTPIGSEWSMNGAKIIHHESILARIKTIGGELGKNGLSEANKALRNYTEAELRGHDRVLGGLGKQNTGALVLVPEFVALFLHKTKNVLLTDKALFAITGFAEFLCAELLELSGNAARDNRCDGITPRHILLAMVHDEEVPKFFGFPEADCSEKTEKKGEKEEKEKNGEDEDEEDEEDEEEEEEEEGSGKQSNRTYHIRGTGAYLDKADIPAVRTSRTYSDFWPEFCRKALDDRGNASLNPLDGRYYKVAAEGEGCYDVEEVVAVPLMDALVDAPASERRKEAIAGLADELKPWLEDELDVELALLEHRQILAGVAPRLRIERTGPRLTLAEFASVVFDELPLSGEGVTREALQLLHEASEQLLAQEIHAANIRARSNNEVVLKPLHFDPDFKPQAEAGGEEDE